MARVTCLGAAATVTGSNFLLETPEGGKYLVDCGLFQGGRKLERYNWFDWGFDPAEIQALFLTHAHIDHSGRIPKLVKDGFTGPIYTTRPTADLCGIMLEDSAHIQEMEAEWQSRKKRRRGLNGDQPLYTTQEAMDSLQAFQPVERNSLIQVSPELSVRFLNAGHILGSSILEIWTAGKEGMKIVFSGDVGQKEQLIVKNPARVTEADYLFMESTYGNRNHRSFDESKAELLEAIRHSVAQGEKVLIPAFAVERTQELLYILSQFHRDGELPDIPVYLDSPLAIKATEIFRNSRQYYDQETTEIVNQGFDPFDWDNLSFTPSTRESMAINSRPGPAIIIAGNGMATAGRIKHHLKHNLWREGASLVIVGFQAAGTTGRRLAEGAKRVRILGETISVRASVYTIGGFSAHADQSDLLDWLGHFTSSPRVFLVHGEPKASNDLAALIRQRFNLTVDIPEFREKLLLRERQVVQEEFGAQAEVADTRQQLIEALQGLETDIQALRSRLQQEAVEESMGDDALERLQGLRDELADLLEVSDQA
jgi:metallo-beta-lactamase family protein